MPLFCGPEEEPFRDKKEAPMSPEKNPTRIRTTLAQNLRFTRGWSQEVLAEYENRGQIEITRNKWTPVIAHQRASVNRQYYLLSVVSIHSFMESKGSASTKNTAWARRRTFSRQKGGPHVTRENSYSYPHHSRSETVLFAPAHPAPVTLARSLRAPGRCRAFFALASRCA